MSNFLNTTLTGLAYVNDLRVVKPQKGKPYFSARLKFLQGEQGGTDQTVHLPVNANLFGSALTILQPTLGSKEAVRILGRVSDLVLGTYTNNKGVIVPTLQGRLYAVSKMWIGDALVYDANTNSSEAPGQESNAHTPSQQEPHGSSRAAIAA